MLELRAASLADTHGIAARIASVCRSGDLIVLSGEMGAGKTAFAQGFGTALGITEPITSPTFTLVHSYDIPAAGPGGPDRPSGVKLLHHADLYRLERTAEIADLALEELAEFHGIVLVEWGDVVDSMFGDHLVVHLEPVFDADAEVDGTDDDVVPARIIEISASGSRWADRWALVTRLTQEFAC